MTTSGLVILFLLGAVAAEGALVKVGRILVRADGGFTPHALPQQRYAPISFRGHAEVESTDSGPVPPLDRVRLEFDRDGRLGVRGLPVCPPGRIEAASPRVARSRCRGAAVGGGRIEATVSLPGRRPVELRSPLSLFNGPRVGGRPTVLAHAWATFPAREVYVVVIPIERLRRGRFGYRATFDVPEVAGGYGALTRAEVKIGRRYRRAGRERSYVYGRCSDGILETRGRLAFVEGTVIEGVVFKPCSARRSGRRR